MSDLLNSLLQEARLWQGHRQLPTNRKPEPTGFTALDQQLGGVGWPRGALSECLLDSPGIGELQLIMPLLKRLTHESRMVFWVNPPFTPYAPALAREGVNLDQVVVIHTGSPQDTLWTLENCLRSPVTGLVMAWPGKLAARDIRRLQLAAETGDNCCLLFRPAREANQSSPAALRLELTAHDNLSMQVVIRKRRGGWPGQTCRLDMAQRAGQAITGPDAHIIQGPWPSPVTQE